MARATPQALAPLIEAFILTKQSSGCSSRTTRDYRWWLDKLAAQVPDTGSLSAVAFARFFGGLRSAGMKDSNVHKAHRVARTFSGWLVKVGAARRSLLDAIEPMRTPKTLPGVPTEEEFMAVLRACQQGLNGRRNYAMLCVMADAGLRSSEVRHLLIENWDRGECRLIVKSGKGKRDRVVFVSPRTARAIKDYLEIRGAFDREDFLFSAGRTRMPVTSRIDGAGREVRDIRQPLRPSRPIGARHLVAILHRLSRRAGLRRDRWLHPHALRHFAATSWIRNEMPLDQVRRHLGHASLNTTLIYSNLVNSDVQDAHRKAGAFEKLSWGD